LRTVSKPGFGVTPFRIFQSVLVGTPDTDANASISKPLRPFSRTWIASIEGMSLLMGRHYPQMDGRVNHLWIAWPVDLDVNQGASLSTVNRSLFVAHEIDTAEALWQNVMALMTRHYGTENLSRLADECGFAQSTATRIKQKKVSPGLDKIDLIARRFNLAAWQLLVPGMDPQNPPTLQPVNAKERDLYNKIMAAAKVIASEPDANKYL
jgi:hypothetical protein